MRKNYGVIVKKKKDQETFSVGNGEKPYNNYTVLVN